MDDKDANAEPVQGVAISPAEALDTAWALVCAWGRGQEMIFEPRDDDADAPFRGVVLPKNEMLGGALRLVWNRLRGRETIVEWKKPRWPLRPRGTKKP